MHRYAKCVRREGLMEGREIDVMEGEGEGWGKEGGGLS